jgi:Rieske Fe-S protein
VGGHRAATARSRVSGVVGRRIVFQGLGAVGVAVVLAGCAGGDEGDEGDEGDPTAPATGKTLATVDEVPVGGGLILGDERIVITQPTEGEFVGFSATCTHQGSNVTSVADGVIECSVHGAWFSAKTGEAEGGPASAPLAVVEIRVDGDRILAV